MSLHYLNVQSTFEESDLILPVTHHSACDHDGIASQTRLSAAPCNAFKGLDGKHIYPA